MLHTDNQTTTLLDVRGVMISRWADTMNYNKATANRSIFSVHGQGLYQQTGFCIVRYEILIQNMLVYIFT